MQFSGAAQPRRIAADVAGDDIVLVLGQGVEEATVGAARAQGRGTAGTAVTSTSCGTLAFSPKHPLPQQLGIQLIQKARQLLAHAGDAGGLDLHLP